jgi:hypothetical protein
MDPHYDIYTTGELLGTADIAETRLALAKLFKTTEDKIAHLLAGKPQLIKRNVEKNEALRYKAALHQAGLLVNLKVVETITTDSAPISATLSTAISPAANTSSTATNPAPSNQADKPIKTTSQGFSLAPAGSDLLSANEKQHIESREIDTSAIKLAATVFITESAPNHQPPAPDTSHLNLAEVGSLLGADNQEPPLPAPDVSHLSVAEVGANLDEIKSTAIALNPDISNLSLAAAGVDLIPANYHKPAPPPAPSTDHIQLAND